MTEPLSTIARSGASPDARNYSALRTVVPIVLLTTTELVVTTILSACQENINTPPPPITTNAPITLVSPDNLVNGSPEQSRLATEYLSFMKAAEGNISFKNSDGTIGQGSLMEGATSMISPSFANVPEGETPFQYGLPYELNIGNQSIYVMPVHFQSQDEAGKRTDRMFYVAEVDGQWRWMSFVNGTGKISVTSVPGQGVYLDGNVTAVGSVAEGDSAFRILAIEGTPDKPGYGGVIFGTQIEQEAQLVLQTDDQIIIGDMPVDGSLIGTGSGFSPTEQPATPSNPAEPTPNVPLGFHAKRVSFLIPATPSLTPGASTENPTAIATANEVPKPSGSENLPQGVNVVYDNESGIWGISMGNEVKAIPGAVFDSTGLHMTIDGKTVDISASELQKRTAYDQKLNLFSVYDDQGIISAEYDPGVGQPNTPDYIPGQGWMNMQDLADKACDRTSTCFIENARGLPNGTTSVNFASTGIFRKINAIDSQTNEPMGGEFLLLQFVTQNTAGKPVTDWMVVQLSMPSKPGVNMSAFVSSVMQLNHGVPLGSTDKSLQSIKQWQNWMPEGSKWSFGFPSDGSFAGSYWSTSQFGSADSQSKRVQFLASHGDISFDGIYPFTSNSASDR